ncbi:MAG: (Fe-S)-binding protein [Thermacetogeniaceae bacterium]|nr:(Fe-S)-binding protein [Peptococcaceae bacterium]
MDEKTIKEYLNRCSKCGGCMAACPLFAETQMEPLVARGKLFLIKNYLDGNLDLSKKMMELMSLCLLCKACTDQCPNSIPVDQLVLSIRQEIAQHKGISFVKKNIFQHFLQNNGRLNIAAKMANLYQRSGLQWLVRKSGILGLLGRDLAKKEKLLPEMAKVPFRAQVPKLISVSNPQMRVAYYTGCVTNYVFPQTGHAVLEILRNHSLEVVIPEQWCCGILALASGDEGSTVELAKKNIKAFQEAGVDYIITDCASCGSMLHEYADLIGSGDAHFFADKVVDLSQFLAEVVDFTPGDKEIGCVVTYHDPCHLNRGQGVREAPRKLLKSLPGVIFKEMKEADRCCGAAGSFNLTYYDLANKVGHRKVCNIKDTGANVVTTECPSCIMQIRHLIELEQIPVEVTHLAELISKSYGGVS